MERLQGNGREEKYYKTLYKFTNIHINLLFLKKKKRIAHLKKHKERGRGRGGGHGEVTRKRERETTGRQQGERPGGLGYIHLNKTTAANNQFNIVQKGIKFDNIAS